MNAITTNRSTRRGIRRVLSCLLVSAAAAAAILSPAANASAATMYLNGSESNVFAGGDTSTHQIVVLPTSLQMSNYPDGQYVVYRVISRDITYSAATAWTYYQWRGPYVVDGRSVYTSCDVMSCEQMQNNTAVSLPNFYLQGVAGHHYQIGVQFGYWTGSSYSYATSIPETYGNTIWRQGVSFTLTNSYALT